MNGHCELLFHYNFRIDYDGNIKIADFGLSKTLYEKIYFRQMKTEVMKLPIKWMAIESVDDGVFSEKSDVVSWVLKYMLINCYRDIQFKDNYNY